MKATIPGMLAIVALTAAPAAGGVTMNDCGGFREFTRTPVVSTWPDTNTLVYEAFFYAGPTAFTRIHGMAPSARWWSFAVLDQKRAEFANLSDEEIIPNPDGTYDVDIRFGCEGAPNCLEIEGNPAAWVSGRIFYRLYVPDGDETGGAGLPTVEVRSTTNEAGEAGPIGEGDSCRAFLAEATRPVQHGSSPHGDDPEEGEAFHLLASASGLENDVCEPGAPPAVNRNRGTGGQQVDQIEGAGVLPQEAIDAIRFLVGATGSGATQANAYVSALYNLRSGNLALRAKAPTYRKQHATEANDRAVDDRSEQVRYWSVCTTQATRPIDCIRDENVVLDADGYFEIVIAPKCPVAGYENCLRGGVTGFAGLGGAPLVLYRNSLPRDDFYNERGPNVCNPGEEETVFCGEYRPVATYVPRDCAQSRRGQTFR
ncbi:MAG: hypothetical protein ACREQY_05865 [Candidatus Binatia bacterium]